MHREDEKKELQELLTYYISLGVEGYMRQIQKERHSVLRRVFYMGIPERSKDFIKKILNEITNIKDYEEDITESSYLEENRSLYTIVRVKGDYFMVGQENYSGVGDNTAFKYSESKVYNWKEMRATAKVAFVYLMRTENPKYEGFFSSYKFNSILKTLGLKTDSNF